MADSQETRVLKDINRHLVKIEENSKSTGISDTLSPSETAALNKNTQAVLGNFSTAINSDLKDSIKASSRAFTEAFGDLKGFNDDNQMVLDEVVDELQMNNRFMAKAEQNAFLKESEREQDLNINRRTNDLLEDMLEKEEDSAALAKAQADDTKGFLSGGLGGLLGGLFAGKSIKGLLGAVKGAGKKVFFPLLIAGAAAEFLRGWAEAGEDASVIDKFNSGIGRFASDLTFGLVSKEFFTNALEGIESAIKDVWSSFTKNWEEFIGGKIGAPDFFANILSDLTMGALSPEQLKKIGSEIESGLADLVDTVVNAMVDGFITPTFDAISEKLTEILDDPVGFAKKKFDEFREKQKTNLEDIQKRATELEKTDNLSRKAALQQAAMEKTIEKTGIVGRITGKATLGLLKKFGLFSETKEEAELEALEKQAEIDLKAKKDEERRLRIETRRRKRLKEVAEVRAGQKEVSKVGQEGLRQRVENERALAEFKKTRESPTGNAMQVNNMTNMVTPADTRTENDDSVNLMRSSGIEGSW